MKNMDFSSRKNKPIVVVGSLNMDLVMRVPRVPVGGETLHGHGFSTLPGGKGALLLLYGSFQPLLLCLGTHPVVGCGDLFTGRGGQLYPVRILWTV